MYHILPESHDNVIGIRVEGFMRAEDYKTLLPFIETYATRYGSVRIVSDLRNFSGIEPGGMLATLPFIFKYSSSVEKKAVITDKRWVYVWARLLAPFFRTEIRCFPSHEAEKAWEWANT